MTRRGAQGAKAGPWLRAKEGALRTPPKINVILLNSMVLVVLVVPRTTKPHEPPTMTQMNHREDQEDHEGAKVAPSSLAGLTTYKTSLWLIRTLWDC